jgi:hypothetical protein
MFTVLIPRLHACLGGALAVLTLGAASPATAAGALTETKPGILQAESGWTWRFNNQTAAFDAATDTITIRNSDPLREWTQALRLPAGQLKPNSHYIVETEYAFAKDNDPTGFAYALLRSDSEAQSGDQWFRFSETDGRSGTLTFEFSTTGLDDTQLIFGLYGTGEVRLSGLSIRPAAPVEQEMIPLQQGWTSPDFDPASVTGCPPFTVDEPRTEGKPTVMLADYMKPARSDQEAFKAALAACKKSGAGRLILAPGVYHFDITTAFTVEGFTDLEIVGNGATLLFSHDEAPDRPYYPEALVVRDNVRLAIRDLIIDWELTGGSLASVGTVTGRNDDGSLNLQMHWPDHSQMQPERLYFRTAHPVLDQPPYPYTYGSEMGYQATPVKVERTGDQAFRVDLGRRGRSLDVGRTYLFRHYDYQRHCISLADNAHLTLDNVDIRQFPGSGYQVSGHQHHWQMVGCDIGPADSTFARISTTADGLHIRQSNGYFRMLDCKFTVCGDDAVNLHDNISAGLQQEDAYTLVALNVIGWRNPFAPGDEVEIRAPDLTPTGYRSRLTAVEYLPAERCRLRFEQPLPADLSPRSVLFNRAYDSANFEIRGCRFAYNLARGLLVHADNGTVADTQFIRNQSAAIRAQIEIEGRWAEGTGVKNLLIENNLVEGVNAYGWHAGAAMVFETSFPGQRTGEPMVRDVVIRGNSFNFPTGPSIWIKDGANFAIVGNHLSGEASIGTGAPYIAPGMIIIEP